MTHLNADGCPCGSQLALQGCCQPYLQGVDAPTPEALMRSRYTAFVLDRPAYLLATWHATTRPSTLPPDPETEWKSLAIVAAPNPVNGKGNVHFRAYFREQSRWHMLEEMSRFLYEQGRWWYVDGEHHVERLKPRRNERCLCGSGRKLKVCCGD